MANSRRSFFIILLLSIAIVLSSCSKGKAGEALEKPPDASGTATSPENDQPKGMMQGPPPVQVEVRAVVARPFQVKVAVTGSTTGYRKASPAAAVDGIVRAIHITEGRMVKKGETLVTIEDDIWKARLREQEAECKRCEAELARFKAGYLPYEIEQKKANVLEIKASWELAGLEYRRKEDLYKKRNISETERDQAKFTYEAAQARLQGAQAELKLLEGGFRKELVDAAGAELEKAVAQREQARVLLDKTKVPAPFDGVIAEKKVEVGEWVTSGTVIATLIDLSQIKVVTYIPEKYISLARLGFKAQVMLDAFPGKDFTGEIIEILPEASLQDRNLQVRFLVPNVENQIQAGMFCRISGIMREVPNALLLHTDAIVKQGTQTVAIKVGPGGAAEFVSLSLGSRDGNWFEILDAGGKIQAGDKVVVTNNPNVSPGAKLIVVREY